MKFLLSTMVAGCLLIGISTVNETNAATKPQTIIFTNVAEVRWESPSGAFNVRSLACGSFMARFNFNKDAWDQVVIDGKTYSVKGIFQVDSC